MNTRNGGVYQQQQHQHQQAQQSGYFIQQPESSRPRLPQLPSIHNLNSPSAMGYGAYSPLLAMDHNPMGGPSGSEEAATPPAIEKSEPPAAVADITAGKEKAGGASDFVKKLYRMLEEGSHASTVSWNEKGNSFVVKDMNEFTKTILPKHFKHSNFASFVRQLNKYDFHKVKKPESSGEAGVYGDHIWEFRHPHFRSHMKSELDQIKRKIPTTRKGAHPATQTAANANASSSQLSQSDFPPVSTPGAQMNLQDPLYINLQRQLDGLAQDQHNLVAHVNNLSRDYSNVMSKMNSFQRNFNTQDSLIQQLIQYLYDAERRARMPDGASPEENANYVASPGIQRLVTAYQDASRVTFEQIDDITRRSSLLTGRLLNNTSMRPESPGGTLISSPHSSGQSPRSGPFGSLSNDGNTFLQQQQQRSIGSDGSGNRFSDQRPPQSHHDQQIEYGRGTGRSSNQSNQSIFSAQPNASQYPSLSMLNNPEQRPVPTRQDTDSGAGKPPSAASAWAVAPKVLLVEDDAVCRKLSSRFLQVFGCQIDLAEDGVSAVNKMNREKYDLVFMDIMMPHLDGVSATSLIRQFDPTTPIISMTSNSNPQEILTYFSHGMNDVLPKPFTKEGLLGMLDKHLLHLKQMQSLTEIPRVLGISDDAIKSALVSTFADPSANNPFADMINDTDYDYAPMLAALVSGNPATYGMNPGRAGTAIDGNLTGLNNGNGNKRDLEDSQAQEASKRSRYGEA